MMTFEKWTEQLAQDVAKKPEPLADYEEWPDGITVIGNLVRVPCCMCGQTYDYPLGRDEVDPADIELSDCYCGGSPRCCP